jgi:hypothetical protein
MSFYRVVAVFGKQTSDNPTCIRGGPEVPSINLAPINATAYCPFFGEIFAPGSQLKPWMAIVRRLLTTDLYLWLQTVYDYTIKVVL